MKRQALAFLSLFSLILMLSVYYVTLPPATAKVVKNEENNKDLQTEIKDNAKDKMKENSEIISSNEASEQEKKDAIKKIDDLEKQQEVIDSSIKSCKEVGYTCSIEIVDETMKVSISDTNSSKDVAKKVMDLLSKLTQQKYFIEISFK